MSSYSGQPGPPPSQPPQPPQPPQPKRTLTRLAIVSFVLGLAVSSIFIWRLVHNIPAEPTAIADGPVRLERAGLTVFASSPAPTNFCTAKDEHGNNVPLQTPKRSEKWAATTRTYYVVAHSTAKIPPQTVTITCTDATQRTYFVGQRHTMGTYLAPALTAVGTFALFFIIGTALIIADTVKRKRATQQHPYPPRPTSYPPGPTV
ncbi:hypothetical protein EV138_6488 [Kribbella voronezhensis]|uniref:Uncharacterized protein n=1 Tax=Kribbella voronezhensis TaxID=2512212 RepID=A0A4R7SYM1_9ACTN|nr:hypothetical protein [Kribbella voronezhensis]TDU84019.1 hypothetical protein EV138_6488 [Kribbella voronezhensis]